ncbi:MAG: hypothetical protein M3371_15105, partial [Acidobacteriota bacterium]|nr:hypothetical protein [Acidobacteriota bacterium]
PIPHGSPAIGRRIVELRLPREALIVLIGREDELVVPNGGTMIEAGDTLLVMANKQTRAEVRAIVGSLHQTEPGTIETSEMQELAPQSNVEGQRQQK